MALLASVTTKLISQNITPQNALRGTMEKKVTVHQAYKYTVKQGDYLWLIATQMYGSGYKAYDIARANNIANPSLIEPGQILTLPDLKVVATQENGQIADGVSTKKITLTAPTYTVQQGDYLWNIAERAYGDGMMWTRIATANTEKITVPDVLYQGVILKIPR